jgi:transcription initiation factor TFIID TATA-box-binding protein
VALEAGDRFTVSIENVVVLANLKRRIDLDRLAGELPYAEYRPELFPGLVLRLREPRIGALLFSSGKMICTGAKSEVEAKRAAMKVVEELRERGVEIDEEPEIRTTNIVASGSVGGRIDLEKTARTLPRTIYETEQFPGLIYRMDDPKVVMLLFATGKFVCTGATMESEVHRALSKLKGILEEKGLVAYS